MSTKQAKQVIMKVSPTEVKWVFPAASGAFKDAKIFTVKIEPGACPFCFAIGAVTALPPPILEKQPDGTTHVCNPALGGCNQGFEKVA